MLVVFDVDGTLLDVDSSWRYLHERLGTWHLGRVYAERFFRGEISYEEWARLDASLWKGLPIQRLRGLIEEIPYVDGALETLRTLKRAGCRVALLSAGLTLATDRICRDTPVDYAVANEVLARNGVVSGEVRVNVRYSEKGKVLREILKRFGVKPSQCAVVGDDETLIPAFKIAGLAIAFNPKTEKVSKNAHITIKTKNLSKTIPHLLKQKI
mgnify:CR=1 FL=1